MTDRTFDVPPLRTSTRNLLDTFFTSLGQGFNAFLESGSRLHEVEALNAKSDEELKAMGLRRDDIPRYVYRDRFGF